MNLQTSCRCVWVKVKFHPLFKNIYITFNNQLVINNFIVKNQTEMLKHSFVITSNKIVLLQKNHEQILKSGFE